MPRLRRVSGRHVIRALEALGFMPVRQLRKDTPDGATGYVVPLHRELAIGTLRGILKQTGVTPGEFMEKL